MTNPYIEWIFPTKKTSLCSYRFPVLALRMSNASIKTFRIFINSKLITGVTSWNTDTTLQQNSLKVSIIMKSNKRTEYVIIRFIKLTFRYYNILS